MAQIKKVLASSNQYDEDIDASPVKSFFVEMLTRDIALEDSILDLLDNCIDGIQRSVTRLRKTFPYNGFYAKINFDKNIFSIEDNCGGIPWDLHKYAFRMGRADPNIDKGIMTVGVYGIGMKRAIFKIGKDCTIKTQDKKDSYVVKISASWMKSDNWNLPVNEASRLNENGTKIEICEINKGIKEQFGSETFLEKLKKMISTNYAYIIEKGFNIKVNKKTIKPVSASLKFSHNAIEKNRKAIAPFIYKAQHQGVNVFLAVGFTSPLVGDSQIDRENYKSRHSAKNAGWTIICNDRVVVHCDRTNLTGWGTVGVPLFHNQFISISGIVEFSSDDASKLPTTTTKRGIDASSSLFIHVRDKMIEGMKIFITYTNQWKGEYLKQSKEDIDSIPALPFGKVKEEAQKIRMRKTRPRGAKGVSGHQFKPELPKPKSKESVSRDCRISFVRRKKEVELVSDYIYGSKDLPPKNVGNQCFEIILENARG